MITTKTPWAVVGWLLVIGILGLVVLAGAACMVCSGTCLVGPAVQRAAEIAASQAATQPAP